MNSFQRIIAVLITLTVGSSAFAANVNVGSFLPKNSFKIPVGIKQDGGLDEAGFNKVIDQVSKYYEPIIKAKGGVLKVNRLWKDATVNASAQRSGNTYIVNMYGGLARHHFVTADGFSLVMCHEVGHHIAGFPKIGTMWASNEGQSDYFATMKCFRRINQKVNNVKRLGNVEVPAIVKEKCTMQFKSSEDIAMCERNSMGGLSLALLLWDLANGRHSKEFFKGMHLAGAPKPEFGTPDKSEAARTNNAHPAAQCRLDTYFNGAACGVAFTEDFQDENPGPGACAEEKGDKNFFRPRCWYKPTK